MDHHPTQILVQMSKLIKPYMHKEAMKILITQIMRLSGRSRAQQVWKQSKKIRRDNWCLLFIVIRGWSYQVPMCGRALLGLNFPLTPKEECTDVGLSCPDLEKVGRREVWLLNAVRCQISKMKPKSLLQIFSLVCYYNDDCRSKKKSSDNEAVLIKPIYIDGGKESYLSCVSVIILVAKNENS